MSLHSLNWTILDRLRAGFISGTAAKGAYWQTEEDLVQYDLTYAERIGWKWDAVLNEVRQRSWSPRGGLLVDWGCGSGIASRRVLEAFGYERFDSLVVWDHSALATDYVCKRAAQKWPALNTTTATPGFLEAGTPIGLLVISHVLNELSAEALASLRLLILRSEAVLWVEPGTRDVGRGLATVRDTLLEEFRVVAPCTHRNTCPLLAPGRENDWCHFFAPAPGEIFAHGDWVNFGKRAGIDLRSLPYSFLLLDRRPAAEGTGTSDETLSRVIGRPEFFKPYARLLNCDASGAAELTLQKRDDKALLKSLDKAKGPLVYRWRREGDFIRTGMNMDKQERQDSEPETQIE